ncbi:hypothetical protein PLESTF_000044600 [Pleodorina starrii]|nr:hypothetical protein PLESTF_000044600 [Pleodorina starrii]
MNIGQSHDGFLGCVERSSHLEEYTRSRPASAGSRPRSLLNKMANAAAAVQLEDEAEPADAEPWVLEGWGDGPSVSEVAQQAALRLGPYVKNVPTTLVGLGGGGGGRRVLSAGHQCRGPLKVSEARRKPGPGPPYSQGDRRSSGPAALAAGGQATTAALRRTAIPRTLDVGDESDVEPTSYAGGASYGSYGQALVPQATPPSQSRITPAQRAGAGLRQQTVQQIAQSTLNAATRLGRREPAAAAVSAASAAAASGDSTNDGSPRTRSASAESYSHGTHGSGAAPLAAGRVPNVSVRGLPPGAAAAGSGSPLHTFLASPAAPAHPLLPPQHPPAQLDPHSGLGGRGAGVVRPPAGPSEPSLASGSTDRPVSGPHAADGQPARSSSFTSSAVAQPQGTHDYHHDSILSPAAGHAFPGAAIASPLSSPALAPGGAGVGAAVQPLLPGLFTAGRRGSSFRADGTGLSGWDTEGPAVQSQPPLGASPQQVASNTSLWTGTTAAGSGLPAPAVGAAAAAAGRGSPLAGGQPPPRRDGSLRIQRGAAAGGSPSAGLLDLSLGPGERSGPGQAAFLSLSRAGRSQAGGPLPAASCSRSASPDVAGRGYPPAGFSAPQQDALTEFCASRAELGSAGAGGGSISGAAGGPTDGARAQGASLSGGVVSAVPVSVPLRMGSLTKTTVGRVS